MQAYKLHISLNVQLGGKYTVYLYTCYGTLMQILLLFFNVVPVNSITNSAKLKTGKLESRYSEPLEDKYSKVQNRQFATVNLCESVLIHSNGNSKRKAGNHKTEN